MGAEGNSLLWRRNQPPTGRTSAAGRCLQWAAATGRSVPVSADLCPAGTDRIPASATCCRSRSRQWHYHRQPNRGWHCGHAIRGLAAAHRGLSSYRAACAVSVLRLLKLLSVSPTNCGSCDPPLPSGKPEGSLLIGLPVRSSGKACRLAASARVGSSSEASGSRAACVSGCGHLRQARQT